MGLRNAIYTDERGRKHSVLLPQEASDEEVERGIPLGPPDLAELGLPEETEVRLHNELFVRGILQANDALRNRQEIFSALQAAFRVDIDRVLTVYVGKDFKNHGHSEPNTDIPEAHNSRRGPRVQKVEAT